MVVTWMFLWTSITNAYAIYICPACECATMLGQSYNCSSLSRIKALLKSINYLHRSAWLLRLYSSSYNSKHLTYKKYPFVLTNTNLISQKIVKQWKKINLNAVIIQFYCQCAQKTMHNISTSDGISLIFIYLESL